ncbi:hypothetical protein VNO77_07243 [Canavalia gladiata]|uniref:Uncharacterized protein n=1 Tax=Canavalia gladiata TaxID=3824 RepID=A0AAN9M8F4_CANGL
MKSSSVEPIWEAMAFLILVHVSLYISPSNQSNTKFQNFAHNFRLSLSLISMSTTSYLLLFFLCLSLHACNARHLSLLDKKLQEKSHFSVKSDDKNGFDSSPKKLNEGDNKMETRLVADSEKPKNRRSINHKVLKAKGKASGSLVQTDSLVSVSWHVPHKKSSHKHPGFNLDYSPPKTHPPHHN